MEVFLYNNKRKLPNDRNNDLRKTIHCQTQKSINLSSNTDFFRNTMTNFYNNKYEDNLISYNKDATDDFDSQFTTERKINNDILDDNYNKSNDKNNDVNNSNLFNYKSNNKINKKDNQNNKIINSIEYKNSIINDSNIKTPNNSNISKYNENTYKTCNVILNDGISKDTVIDDLEELPFKKPSELNYIKVKKSINLYTQNNKNYNKKYNNNKLKDLSGTKRELFNIKKPVNNNENITLKDFLKYKEINKNLNSKKDIKNIKKKESINDSNNNINNNNKKNKLDDYNSNEYNNNVNKENSSIIKKNNNLSYKDQYTINNNKSYNSNTNNDYINKFNISSNNYIKPYNENKNNYSVNSSIPSMSSSSNRNSNGVYIKKCIFATTNNIVNNINNNIINKDNNSNHINNNTFYNFNDHNNKNYIKSKINNSKNNIVNTSIKKNNNNITDLDKNIKLEDNISYKYNNNHKKTIINNDNIFNNLSITPTQNRFSKDFKEYVYKHKINSNTPEPQFIYRNNNKSLTKEKKNSINLNQRMNNNALNDIYDYEKYNKSVCKYDNNNNVNDYSLMNNNRYLTNIYDGNNSYMEKKKFNFIDNNVNKTTNQNVLSKSIDVKISKKPQNLKKTLNEFISNKVKLNTNNNILNNNYNSFDYNIYSYRYDKNNNNIINDKINDSKLFAGKSVISLNKLTDNDNHCNDTNNFIIDEYQSKNKSSNKYYNNNNNKNNNIKINTISPYTYTYNNTDIKGAYCKTSINNDKCNVKELIVKPNSGFLITKIYKKYVEKNKKRTNAKKRRFSSINLSIKEEINVKYKENNIKNIAKCDKSKNLSNDNIRKVNNNNICDINDGYNNSGIFTKLKITQSNFMNDEKILTESVSKHNKNNFKNRHRKILKKLISSPLPLQNIYKVKIINFKISDRDIFENIEKIDKKCISLSDDFNSKKLRNCFCQLLTGIKKKNNKIKYINNNYNNNNSIKKNNRKKYNTYNCNDYYSSNSSNNSNNNSFNNNISKNFLTSNKKNINNINSYMKNNINNNEYNTEVKCHHNKCDSFGLASNAYSLFENYSNKKLKSIKRRNKILRSSNSKNINFSFEINGTNKKYNNFNISNSDEEICSNVTFNYIGDNSENKNSNASSSNKKLSKIISENKVEDKTDNDLDNKIPNIITDNNENTVSNKKDNNQNNDAFFNKTSECFYRNNNSITNSDNSNKNNIKNENNVNNISLATLKLNEIFDKKNKGDFNKRNNSVNHLNKSTEINRFEKAFFYMENIFSKNGYSNILLDKENNTVRNNNKVDNNFNIDNNEKKENDIFNFKDNIIIQTNNSINIINNSIEFLNSQRKSCDSSANTEIMTSENRKKIEKDINNKNNYITKKECNENNEEKYSQDYSNNKCNDSHDNFTNKNFFNDDNSNIYDEKNMKNNSNLNECNINIINSNVYSYEFLLSFKDNPLSNNINYLNDHILNHFETLKKPSFTLSRLSSSDNDNSMNETDKEKYIDFSYWSRKDYSKEITKAEKFVEILNKNLSQNNVKNNITELMNILALDNFDSILKKIKKILYNNARNNIIEIFLIILIDKSIFEPNFAVLYAKLVKEISEYKEDNIINNKKKDRENNENLNNNIEINDNNHIGNIGENLIKKLNDELLKRFNDIIKIKKEYYDMKKESEEYYTTKISLKGILTFIYSLIVNNICKKDIGIFYVIKLYSCFEGIDNSNLSLFRFLLIEVIVDFSGKIGEYYKYNDVNSLTEIESILKENIYPLIHNYDTNNMINNRNEVNDINNNNNQSANINNKTDTENNKKNNDSNINTNINDIPSSLKYKIINLFEKQKNGWKKSLFEESNIIKAQNGKDMLSFFEANDANNNYKNN